MLRFGRGSGGGSSNSNRQRHSKSPAAASDGDMKTASDEAEEIFRDVFADVKVALLYDDKNETKAAGSSQKKPNPFGDEDDDDNNINSNAPSPDPWTSATDVFKKKKPKNSSTTANPAAISSISNSTLLVDTSETSATSNTSQDYNLDDSVSTVKTSNQQQRKTTTSPAPVTTKTTTTTQQQLSCWHEGMVATETQRQQAAQRQLQYCRHRWQAWKRLLQESIHETQATVRWLVGIQLARDHLLQSLELGSSSGVSIGPEDDEDDVYDDDYDGPNETRTVDNDGELPEKPIVPKVHDENNTDSTTAGVDTNAAALPLDPKNRGDDNKNNNPAKMTVERTKSESVVPTLPPPTAITIPSRNAQPHEPVFVLFRQHNMLHQNLLTMLLLPSGDEPQSSSSSQQPQSRRVQEWVQQLQTSAVTLQQEALERVRQLEQVEAHGKQAWDTYFTTANEMFAAQKQQQHGDNNNSTPDRPNNGSDSDGVGGSNNKITSVGDVWLAELAYRCALHQQAAQWADRGRELETFLGQAHEVERQRRLKLRHILMEGVLQKHAAAWERIQKVHTEALEQFFQQTAEGNNSEDINNSSSNNMLLSKAKSSDSMSTKEDQSKKPHKGQRQQPKTYTTRERMESMARKAGTTPVMDEEEEKNQRKEEEEAAASVAVDVDSVDPRDLEESELPLLKDAASRAEECRKQKKRDKFAKIKSGVILDLASNKNALFLDRILYSGSLLESHYIHMAVVAGIEEDAISPVIDDSLRKADLKPLLVVVSSDRTVHMFEIPRPSRDEDQAIQQQERAIVPGSSPDAALFYLLGRQAARNVKDNNAKDKALLLEEEAAAQLQQQQQQRPKFIRTRTKTALGPTPAPPPFHFDNLRPTVTFAVADYLIRENHYHGIKITSKDRDRYDPVQGKSYSKLNFASATDLQSFLLACELNKGELTTI